MILYWALDFFCFVFLFVIFSVFDCFVNCLRIFEFCMRCRLYCLHALVLQEKKVKGEML